ncbi:MAG: hypothetical protein ABR924_15760 [Terracidiphilus sp.]
MTVNSRTAVRILKPVSARTRKSQAVHNQHNQPVLCLIYYHRSAFSSGKIIIGRRRGWALAANPAPEKAGEPPEIEPLAAVIG